MNALLIKFAGLTAAAVLAFSPLAATTASAQQDAGRSAGASCDAPNVGASTIYAQPPETPAIAETNRLTGTALVQVDLDANGSIVGTSIAKSSGAPILDRAALLAASGSTFHPEVRNCTPVAGSYLFEVQFPE